MNFEVQIDEWQNGEFSVGFMIYRWCFATWFTVTMGFSLKEFFINGKWFIYFTNWGYTLCTLVAIYSALLVSIYCRTLPNPPCPYWVMRLYWALHISSFVCATGLSFIYWVFIYPYSNFQLPEDIRDIEIIRIYRYFFNGPNSRRWLTYFHNINSHGINAILMILDQVVVAFPARIMHFIYPAIIVIAYVLFSLAYHFMDGKNMIGKPYIYKILNWGEYPFSSALVACGGILLVFPMCLLGYLIYKIRINVSSANCPS